MSTPEEEGIPALPPQRPVRQYDMPDDGRGMPQARHQQAQERPNRPQAVNPMGGERARYQEPQNVVRPNFPHTEHPKQDKIFSEYNLRHYADLGYVPARIICGWVFVAYSSYSSIILGYNEFGYVTENEIMRWVMGSLLACMLFFGALYTAERAPYYYWMVVFVDALITAGFTVGGIQPMLEHRAILPIAFLGMSIYIICMMHAISARWMVPFLIVPIAIAVFGIMLLPTTWFAPVLAWAIACFIGYALGRAGEEMIVGKRRQLIIGTKIF